VLEEFAEAGNPEALTTLGRLYEKGIYFKINPIKAAMNYILASQLNYPRAKMSLIKIISPEFITKLISEVKTERNPDALFTLYGLSILGLYNQITEEEAVKFLRMASDDDHLVSLIELGNNYYTGKIKNANADEGIDLWQKAVEEGSRQAKIRLAAVNIIEGIKIESISVSIQTLQEALEFGSVLAQISLAYAYEKGIGVPINKAEAVKYYRITAQRGNQSGYEELKRIYDDIRPADHRFNVN
jgi:hypothetical protein